MRTEFDRMELKYNMLKATQIFREPQEYFKTIHAPFEYQYSNSLDRIIHEGIEVGNRTGINTKSIQHQHFVLEDVINNFPRIRGKKVFPRMALKELCWMLLGRTDIKWLQDRGVNYWNEWSREDGTIGSSYGKQFRNFNGIDQIPELLHSLINNPLSRRHIINLWNVNDLPDMSLPPCFYDFHFCCIPTGFDNKYYVDLHVHSRSEDSFIGQPYDFMFVSLFLIVICNFLNNKSNVVYIARNVNYTADDYHMYVNHTDQVKEYLHNVVENKEQCIDCNQTLVVLSDKLLVYEDFDKYVQALADYKELITFVSSNDNFEYPQIKAPVAI